MNVCPGGKQRPTHDNAVRCGKHVSVYDFYKKTTTKSTESNEIVLQERRSRSCFRNEGLGHASGAKVSIVLQERSGSCFRSEGLNRASEVKVSIVLQEPRSRS